MTLKEKAQISITPLYSQIEFSAVTNNGRGWSDDRTQYSAIVKENEMKRQNADVVSARREIWWSYLIEQLNLDNSSASVDYLEMFVNINIYPPKDIRQYVQNKFKI